MTLKKIREYIIKNELFGNNELVTVALSGGFDSVCMLHCLKALGFKLCAAHVNHSLRAAADADTEYVRALTKQLEIPLYEVKYDVKRYAEENKLSLETAGRFLRYEFFEQIAKEQGGVVATAHNANDNAESFMMHLMRGSGISGLTGIRPSIIMNGTKIVRPILCLTRTEIEDYCKANNLNPRLDESNLDKDFQRNEIRYEVIPPISQRGGIEAISRATEILYSEEDYLNRFTDDLINENGTKREDGDTIYSLKWFNSLHIAVKRRIIRRTLVMNWMHPVSLAHIDAVINACTKNYGGKTIQLPGMLKADVKNGCLILGRR